MKKISRRGFLKGSALAGAAALAGNAVLPAAAVAPASSSASSSSAAAEEENSLFANVSVTEAALPSAGWQADPTFPDWAGYVDDTLALNGM